MRGSWWWGCVLGLFLICAARPVRAERVEKDGWKLGGSHLVLSVERLATLAVWREVEQEWAVPGVETRTGGTDATLLTANTTHRALAVPRIAFDYVTSLGLTAGGSLGYVRAHGIRNTPEQRQYVVAPRVGGLIALDRIAIWLRGGVTVSSWSSTHANHEYPPCDDCSYDDPPPPPPSQVTESRTTYALSFDPQLLVCLAPRIALSVGISIDQGLEGSYRRDYLGDQYDVDFTSSSYALTTGISAIF